VIGPDEAGSCTVIGENDNHYVCYCTLAPPPFWLDKLAVYLIFQVSVEGSSPLVLKLSSIKGFF
jgi:hypothetical protein